MMCCSVEWLLRQDGTLPGNVRMLLGLLLPWSVPVGGMSRVSTRSWISGSFSASIRTR